MNETQLKAKILRWLKTIPELWVYKAADKFTAGIPDLIICCKGRFVAIELKAGNNKTSKIQNYCIAKIKYAGGVTAICYTLEQVKEVIINAGE